MRPILVFAVVSGLALTAGNASGHAFLKSATPGVGSTVQQAPSEVVITFTEGIEPKFTTISVQDSSGADVSAGSVHLVGGDTQLAVGLKPLQPGTYKVVWHAIAVDTHKTEGSFTFTVTK